MNTSRRLPSHATYPRRLVTSPSPLLLFLPMKFPITLSRQLVLSRIQSRQLQSAVNILFTPAMTSNVRRAASASSQIRGTPKTGGFAVDVHWAEVGSFAKRVSIYDCLNHPTNTLTSYRSEISSFPGNFLPCPAHAAQCTSFTATEHRVQARVIRWRPFVQWTGAYT